MKIQSLLMVFIIIFSLGAQQPQRTRFKRARILTKVVLDYGQTEASTSFPIDLSEDVSSVAACKSPLLQLTLVGPDGTTHSFRSDKDDRGLPVTSQKRLYYLSKRGLPAGVYQLKVKSSVPFPLDVGRLVCDTMLDPTVANELMIKDEDGCFVGEPALVRFRIFDDGTKEAVPNISFQASVQTVQGTTGRVLDLDLKDDGVSPDEIAGDGWFSGTFVPDAPGQWQVDISVDGTGSTGVFHRDDSATTIVKKRRSRVSTGKITTKVIPRYPEKGN